MSSLAHSVDKPAWLVYWERSKRRWNRYSETWYNSETSGGSRYYHEKQMQAQVERLKQDPDVKYIKVVYMEPTVEWKRDEP